jgi:hypothetical protein
MHDDHTISYVGERDWDEIRAEAQKIQKVEGNYVLRFGAIYEVTTTKHYLVVPPRRAVRRADP